MRRIATNPALYIQYIQYMSTRLCWFILQLDNCIISHFAMASNRILLAVINVSKGLLFLLLLELARKLNGIGAIYSIPKYLIIIRWIQRRTQCFYVLMFVMCMYAFWWIRHMGENSDRKLHSMAYNNVVLFFLCYHRLYAVQRAI